MWKVICCPPRKGVEWKRDIMRVPWVSSRTVSESHCTASGQSDKPEAARRHNVDETDSQELERHWVPCGTIFPVQVRATPFSRTIPTPSFLWSQPASLQFASYRLMTPLKMSCFASLDQIPGLSIHKGKLKIEKIALQLFSLILFGVYGGIQTNFLFYTASIIKIRFLANIWYHSRVHYYSWWKSWVTPDRISFSSKFQNIDIP